MGKRERRRRRERAKKQRIAPTSVILEFPRDAPHIRVFIKADQPQELQELAKRYWEFTEASQWACTVGSLGDQQWVSETVAAVSHALLLHAPCHSCSEPIRVPNRSWAVKVASAHLDRRRSDYLCPECSAVLRQEKDRERERQLEAARAEKDRKKAEADEQERRYAQLLADEAVKDATGRRVPYDSPVGLLLYLAVVKQVTARPGKPLPSLLDTGPLCWTGDIDQDQAALLALYYAKLLAIAPQTPREALVLTSDDLGFYSARVQWRLVGENASIKDTAKEINDFVLTGNGQEAHTARRTLADVVEHMEIMNVVSYLDGLLTNRYQYPEVPEGRRQELIDIVGKGLSLDYTPGQLICFAWRAADTAAAWKERQGLGPAEASSGTVTILNEKIEKAVGAHHSIPEYEPPRSHQQPLALTVLRELAAQVKRIYSRSAINACTQCDPNGFRDLDDDTVVRCTHAPAAQEPHHQDEQPTQDIPF
ncbi:hypothetical protein ACFVH6_23405 [Spirillospora sp. NPDC127200]